MKANIIGNELKITKNNGEELTCYLSNIALYEFLINGTVKFFFKFGPFNEVTCKLGELYVNGVQSTKSDFENAISSSNTIIDTGGLEKTIANSEMPLSPNYISPYDYTVTYKTSITLDCIPLNGSPDVDSNICNIVSLVVTRADGNVVKFLHGNLSDDGVNKVALSAVGNVLTILNGGTTPFLATDTKYRLGVNYQQKAYDPISDSNKSFLNNYPVQPIQLDILDTTNVTAATNYYPSSDGIDMGIHNNFSLSGYILDADGVITMTLEGTNDEDLATGDWHTIYAYNLITNAQEASWAVTNTGLYFALILKDCKFNNIRIKVVNNGATNTMRLKGRLTY